MSNPWFSYIRHGRKMELKKPQSYLEFFYKRHQLQMELEWLVLVALIVLVGIAWMK